MTTPTTSLVVQLYPTLCNPMDCSPPGSSAHGILQARVLEWSASFLLQGIFPTQGLNLDLPHCRQTLFPLSHQGCSKGLDSLWEDPDSDWPHPFRSAAQTPLPTGASDLDPRFSILPFKGEAVILFLFLPLSLS